MSKLRSTDPCEDKMITRQLFKNVAVVSKEIQRMPSHTYSIDGRRSAVESTEESKSLNESEKKRLSPASRNKPPELVPYCDDVPVSDPNEDSSPPHLFPEGIITRTKLNKSVPGKTVKDIWVVSIASSPPQKQDEVKCEFDKSSESGCDEEYISAEKLKRKVHPLCKSVGLHPMKRRKSEDRVETDYERKDSEKSVSNFFINMKMGKARLKERDKLRKASERMRRSPRALIPKDENTNMLPSSVHERHCGDDVSTSGSETFRTSTDSDDVSKCSASSAVLDREWSRTFSQKPSCTLCKGVHFSPLSQDKEGAISDIMECIDASRESIGSVESKYVKTKPYSVGGYVRSGIASSEAALKQQCTETNKDYSTCKESLKNGCTELCHNHSARDVAKGMQEESRSVVEKIYNVSKIAAKDSDASVCNEYSKAQYHTSVCPKSGIDSDNFKVRSLRCVCGKLKRVSTEQIRCTSLQQKQVSSITNCWEKRGDEKECSITENAGDSAVRNSNKDDDSSSCCCKETFKTCETKTNCSNEIASHMPNEELKKDEMVMQTQSAEFAKCDCDSNESNTLGMKKNKENEKQIVVVRLHEDHRKVDCHKCSLGSTGAKVKKYESICREISNMSESNLKTYANTTIGNKKETSCVMVPETSSDRIFPGFLGKSNFNGTYKLNNCHISGKSVSCQSNVSSAEIMVDSFGRDLLAGCDIAQESPDVTDPNMYVTLDPNNWPVIEGDEDDDYDYDDDDYIFTLPQRVSTGKEERDIIDGIEMLSFETEHDMVEFTKIQQDFCHGSSIDDGMIQSDDGLDMMDDSFAHSGDVDLQYARHVIVLTKTNDITKIKGWRNKQFAVNDNPSRYSGFSNEAFEEDDGFESCDVKTTDETNMEEDQQNHWYSEDAKHDDTDLVGTFIGDEDSQVTEERIGSTSLGKQKINPVKDDVMLSSGAVIQPEAVEPLKHLQASITETNNSKSAFVSDVLDNYLSAHSQLNVSYEIPKLGAEEGITHHSEHETDQFLSPSPPKPSHTVSEKPSVPRKTAPKPKTLAEKRKLLEKEMREAEYIKGHKKRQRGRPRLHPKNEPVTPIKFQKHFESKMPVTLKITPSVPEKEDLEQKVFSLDPDYKYAWIGKRPIRITGSNVNREPTVNEHVLLCNVEPQIKLNPTHVSMASDITKDKNEVNTDTKLSYETREWNNSTENITACSDLQPRSSHDSTNPFEYGVVVFPGVGHPLHPFAIKHLMFLRSSEVCIDRKWAEFAVAVVTSRKDIGNHERTEKHTILVRDTLPFQDLNLETNSSKNNEISPSESGNISLNTEIPRDCDLTSSSFKITQMSPNPELSKPNLSCTNTDSSVGSVEIDLGAKSVNHNNGKADNNLSSNSSFEPCDTVLIEVKIILTEMIDCVLNHEIENTIIQDDPDAASSVTVITPKCSKKVVSKYMKNKVYRELNRLNVNVIVMGEDRNGYVEKTNGDSFCEQDFCRLGCVCASLEACQSNAALSDHCGNAECMFECCCQEPSTNQSSSNSAEEKPSPLYSTAIRLQDEGNRHLAKVEKEFRHTVIQSKNEVIVIGGGSNSDGGRRRREKKLPERYRDSSLVLGKEFAMAEFKMMTGEDINATSALSGNTNTRRERQLYVPNYVELGVLKSPTASIAKPPRRSSRGKLTLDQKMSLLCEHFKVKSCKVRIERMEGLEGVVPWCMVHSRYNCFCSGQSLKPFKRMFYRPIERPPPVPSVPLDSTGTKVDTVKQHCAPRNVAVKSTSHSTTIHTHNVNHHSARTSGTTVNYCLRNQSHSFRRQHERIHLEDSETMKNVISAHYSPFTPPVNKISKLDMMPGDSVMSAPFSLNEQGIMPNNSDLVKDNEEVGFGKIVSITSLRPEEFEKCGSVDQSHDDEDEEEKEKEEEGACNADMFVNPERQSTEFLSGGTNISEGSAHLIQTKMKTLNFPREQECHSEEQSHENEIFGKPSSALIPILPEGSNDINSVRLAELISKKDSELRSILENCIVPLNLSQTTIGSIQLINWKILLDQVESKIYHLWLQYKHGSVPKLIVTGTADKPDQYCISLHDTYPHSLPDFHSKLPPFIIFLIEQLCISSRIPGINSGGINCFGLLQFDGNNWVLVGSFQRNIREVEQIQTTEQAGYRETSKSQQQDHISVETSQKEIPGVIIGNESSISGEKEIRKEEEEESKKFNQENESNKNAVASCSSPHKNLRKCLCDIDSSQESVNENLQVNEEPSVKQHGQKQESYLDPNVSLQEQDSPVCESILCETTGILIDPNKPLGPQLVQARSVDITGTLADLTETCRGHNEHIGMVSYGELTSDGVSNNDQTVINCVEQKFVTTGLKSVAREVVHLPDTPLSVQNLSTQSPESVCCKSDPKVICSQEQIKSDDTLKGNDCEITMVVSQEQISLISEETKDTTNLESAMEHPLPSSTGKTPVSFSANSCNFDSIIHTSGVEVPLPTGPDPARWYMLNIRSHFDLLHIAHSKCIIRYSQLLRAVYLANSHGKTVRVPLQKIPKKEIHSKNSHVSDDKKQAPDTTQPKFGVYTVPNLYTRVFIGPYGLRDEAGVCAIKIVNGKLVNTMYLDKESNSSADTNESFTSLLKSGGKEAILNKKMEQLYDSVALPPKDGGVCRGLWLYTAKSEDRKSKVKNVKASVVSLDWNGVSSGNSSAPLPVTGMGDGKSNFAVDRKESYTECHAEMEDSKSHSENGNIAQYSLKDGIETESRRQGSRRKQTLELKNDVPVTISCHKISVHKTSRDMGQEFVKEEGENVDGSHLAVTESCPSTADVFSSVKSDSDEEILDVETPCDTGELFRKTYLLMKKKTRRNINILENLQKQFVPGSRGDEASTISMCGTASVNSVDSVLKNSSEAPKDAEPLFPQGSPVMSVGKTAVEIKLVPSIPSVGYIKAVMYHNKSVMLNSPFSLQGERVYFKNLETASHWLTDELKKKVEFIPHNITLLWRVKHATVDTKFCELFNCKILNGSHFLTEIGVFGRQQKSTVAHTSLEPELLHCFHKLGSTFLSEEQLCRTDSDNILKLAINEVKNVDLTNMKLLSELEVLSKRRLTNFSRFYQLLKALPFIEDRNREMAKLKEVLGDKIPVVFNVNATFSDASSRKSKDSSHHAQNVLPSHKFDRENRNESNPGDCITNENCVGDSVINTEMINNEKPLIAHSLQLKEGVDDDSVSVSISVVQDDEPVPTISDAEDRDVVTVTRIPRGCVEDKLLQDVVNRKHKSFVSKAEDAIHSKFSASGKQRKSEVTTVLDILQVIPSKPNTDTSERQDNHIVKMDELIGSPSKSEKEVNDISPENLSTVGILKKSSDESIGFIRFPAVQKINKSEEVTRKAVSEQIVQKEPRKLLMGSLDVKDAVPDLAKNRSDTDEEIDVGGSVSNGGGVWYTLMPSERKRISISVDNKTIRTSTSPGARPFGNIQDTNFILHNADKFNLKQQQLGLNSSGNLILPNNVNDVEDGLLKKVRAHQLSRNLQKNCVKADNSAEKDIAVKNPVSDLPTQMSICKSPSTNETVSVSAPSLKGNILHGQSSDLKYAVFDNSKCKLVSGRVLSGNKMGHHVLTSGQIGKNINSLSCTDAAQKIGTATPVFVTVLPSACSNTTMTSSSISASTVKNSVATDEGSNQRTKQVRPQIASSVGHPSSHFVHVLQPVNRKNLCAAGNRLIGFERSKNNQYLICNGHKVYSAPICYPIYVPTQSPSSVVKNSKNLNSGANINSIPLLAVANPNTSLNKNCHRSLESSIVKPVQPSKLSTNSLNPTIEIERLQPGVCAAVVPDKVRKISCDLVSDTYVPTTNSFPKSTLTTRATHTNSTASHVLMPDLVNTAQNKPVVSVVSSDSHAATILPPKLESSSGFTGLIPVSRKVPSGSHYNLKKNSTFCFRTAASNISISKIIATDVKSMEPEPFNLNVASPVSSRRLFMESVTGFSDITCSKNSVYNGNRIGSEKTEKVSNRQPVVADMAVTSNRSENREISENNGSVDVRSETNFSILGSSDEKSQCDISSGRTDEKLRNKSVYSVRASAKKLLDRSAMSLPKQDSPNTLSPKSKSKAQEDTGNTAKHMVRAGSGRNRTKSPVEMMVTRSNSRRKLVLYKLKSCT